MAYREIVTKAVIAKGKKTFTTTDSVTLDKKPSTILGCWIINHNFSGEASNNMVIINGSYDVNIWYSYDNDTKTDVVKKSNTYKEAVNMHPRNEKSPTEEIIVRSLKQPNCLKVDINGNTINYTVEKELGIELVDDVKVRIEASNEEDTWDEIVEDKTEEIDKIEENFLK